MGKKLAVILASGGMDSCLTAAIANQKHRLAFLHANYGQRTELRELKAFNEQADYFQVEKRLVVNLSHLKMIGGSSLTDKKIQLEEADLTRHDIPASYVPFRNANLASIATSWAEVIGANYIYIGAVEEDSSGYPDCRKIFYEAFNHVIALGTKGDHVIEIVTPVIHLKKQDIVKKGMELNVPFHLTWSCYQSEEIACGECDSCALRLRGFQLAGVDDLIPYRHKQRWDHNPKLRKIIS
jgi:7-cyano-7-deazaguanine synthase